MAWRTLAEYVEAEENDFERDREERSEVIVRRL
jgi:hypothetical protein